mgnify:CR=1 FL=1
MERGGVGGRGWSWEVGGCGGWEVGAGEKEQRRVWEVLEHELQGLAMGVLGKAGRVSMGGGQEELEGLLQWVKHRSETAQRVPNIIC